MEGENPSDYGVHGACGTHPPARSPKRGRLEDVLKDIRAKDVGRRMAALERLGENPRTWRRAILELVNAPESDVRTLACDLIGDVKPSGALRALMGRIDDRDCNVRQAACTALGKLGSPRAVRALTRALRDTTWVACAAASSLGEIGGERARRRLLQVFHEGGGLKAIAACRALMAWNDAGVQADVVKTLKKWRGKKRSRFVMMILEEGGKEILDRLKCSLGDDLLSCLRFLVTGNHKVALRLLAVAASFRSPEAVSLILRELAKRDPDEEEYQDTLSLLVDLHGVWKDRPEAYLGQLDEGFVVPMLRACAMTGTRVEPACLLDILPQSSLEVRREISRSLTLITEPALRLVESLLFDRDDHVRGYAAEAAGFFSMKEMASRIKDLAQTGYPDTRQKAFRSLCILDPVAARVLAEEFVSSGSAEDQRIYLSAAELMDRDLNYRLVGILLESRDDKVAAFAVRIMGNLIEQDSRYLDMMGELLARKRALPEVLEIIKNNRLTDLQPELLRLQDGLRHDPWLRYQTLSALAAMEDEGLFDVFAAGLRDEHNLVKIGCIKALARLRQERARGLILPFLSSADADLCHAARTAVDVLMTPDDQPTPAGSH